MIGQKLGSYELIEEIGHGGMATVYRAHQASIKRDVAIKLIRKNIADSPDAVHRFQREAQLIAQLEHPHILPVYDFDGRHEPPYIVMRYLIGGTMKEIMAQGLLPLHEVAHLMQQVCGAVDYSHRQGIIHRDLKPSNILVDRESNAFVMDFGIARMASDPQEGKGITKTGVIIGTPAYMSPEQAMGAADIDHRTDIYALGVMLFEMLTGQLPYSAPTLMGTLMMHAQDPIPSVSTLNRNLPDKIDELMKQVLAKKPDQRFESAATFNAALIDLIGQGTTNAPSQLRLAAETLITRRLEVGQKDKSTGSSTGASEQNRAVTAVYASASEYGLLVDDVAGSEASARALHALLREYVTVVTTFEGRIFLQSETDILALWGAGNARENDAEQALRCALALQKTLKKLGAAFLEDADEPLPLSIGIHSGMVLLQPAGKTETFSATGTTLSIANRLMQQANGEILITHDTFRQVMGIFDIKEETPLKIRGRKDPILTYQVKNAKARAFHIHAPGIEGIETKMVGRDSEFKLLQQAYLDAFEDGETQVVTVLSDAGLGKSRLLYEFDKWTELREETYRIFNGQATANMQDRPYALIRDMISFRFDIQDSDALSVVQDKLEKGIVEMLGRDDREMAHMIGYLCGFELVESPHIKGLIGDGAQIMRRGRQLFLRLFTQLCAIQPVMVALEDIHHADNLSLDLFNELFEAGDERRLMVVCNARPSLLERRPAWGSGQEFHRRITLEPLSKRDSRELARELLQKVTDIPKDLRDLLVERSEGNPFYMEELVLMLIDERVIHRVSEDEWSLEIERLEGLSVPKTLNGLLASRLDTLLQPEKLTLQRASVIGRVFYDAALHKIDSLDETHVNNLEAILAKLTGRQFIHKREVSAFEGVTEYIFASNMLHDAIENALLERQLATYNRATAEWLIEIAAERATEYSALIADYYERAGEKVQSAKYLTKASESVSLKGATPEALLLIKRALALLPNEKSLAYAEVTFILADLQFTLGETALAQSLLEKTLTLAQNFQNDLLQCKVLVSLAKVYKRLGDSAKEWDLLEESLRLVGEDIEQQLLIMGFQAWHKMMYQGKPEEAEIIAKQMIELAQTHQLYRQIMNGLNVLGVAYLSQDRLDEGRKTLEEGLALANTHNDRPKLSLFLGNLGEAARQQGDFTQAKSYYLDGLAYFRESQYTYGIAIQLLNLASTALSLRDAVLAREYALEALPVVQKMKMVARIVSIVGVIAGIKILENKVDEGLALLGFALNHPVVDDDTRREFQTVFKLLPESMSQAEIDTGMAHGHALNLDAVVADWLAKHGK